MCENVNSRRMRTEEEEELTLVDARKVDWWECRYYSSHSIHRLTDLEEIRFSRMVLFISFSSRSAFTF